MTRATTAFKSALFARIRSWFGSPRKPGNRRRRAAYRRPFLECLEDRLAPATLHQAGAVLTITLDQPNEALALVSHGTDYGVTSTSNFVTDGTVTAANFTGFNTLTGDVTAAGLAAYTEIDIVDAAAGTSVTFNDSGTNAYTTNITINLTNAASGGVTFNGTTTFSNASLNAVAHGTITSATGSTVQTTAAGGNLVLQSTGGGVTLGGTLANPGPGTATLSGNSVQFGPATNVAQLLTVTAVNGTITQTGPITTGAGSSFSATGGSITLSNATNNFGGPVALSTNLANGITVVNSARITLGNTTLGTGTLNVTAHGGISQTSGAIQTQGPVNLTIANAAADVVLNSAPNNIAGTVTVAHGATGKVLNLALRNDFENASPPVITGLALNNYTLRFSNTGISLPAVTLTGNLSVTAGGPISEGGNLSAVNGSFSVLGNFGIDLTGATNTFSGTVSLNDPSADAAAAVALTNSGAVTLDNSNLGLGPFSVTATSGNITEESGATVTQTPGAGPATFTATTGTTVTLGNTGNDFAGSVSIQGAGITTVSLDNADTLASVPTLPSSVTDLTLNFENAPVAFPSFTGLSLANLTVTANGIYQQAGSTLAVGTLASFTAGAFPLLLANAGNNFNQVALNNSGPDDVRVQTTGALVLAASSIGSGQLAVSAGGAISETGAVKQAADAAGASFTTGAFAITLDQGNTFTGPVAVSNTGTNGGTINNTAALVLGSSSIGAGLTVTATSGSITQAPGTAVVTGAATASFTAAANVSLGNPNNSFGGPVSITAANATLQNDGAISLGTTSIATGGTLTVRVNPAASNQSIAQAGAVTAPAASFRVGNTGTGSSSGITLTNAGNTFGTVSFTAGSSQNVALTNTGGLTLGNVTLGGGTLTVTTGGNISQASGTSITGVGSLTLNPGTANSVSLGWAGNLFGPVTVNATDVTLTTQGDLTLSATSTMTGNVSLTAGGQLTLPAGNLSVASLTVSANDTAIAQNITTTSGGISFTGDVTFTTAVTLDTSASASGTISFNGNVTNQGALNLNLSGSVTNAVTFASGTWNEGSNPLTVSGTGDGFTIGGTGSDRATFVMTGGTLSLSGQGNLTVETNSTFEVGGTAAVVTVANGSGTLTFNAGAELLVGLGGATSANDELVKQGTGNVSVAGATLSGIGLAGANATPVLSAGGGQIVGFFSGTVAAAQNNSPHTFLMGSDIVTPAYTGSTLSVKQGGSVSATGTVTGFEADSDAYKVTVTGGATAGLVVITDVSGRVDIVVRNGTAAQTLTVTTTRSVGNGLTSIGGFALDGTGPATIIAPTADVFGDIRVSGPLASLSVHNMTGVEVQAAGSAGQLTSITGAVFDQVAIDLGSALNSLAVTAFTDSSGTGASSVTAARFGTIRVTGNAAAAIPGDCAANLADTAPGTASAVGTATVAHQLSGTWDLTGAVGSVTAARTSNWQLGVPNGANARNGGALGSVAALNLGVVSTSSVDAGAGVGAVTATSWTGGSLQARFFGSVATTGSAALGDHGNFTANLTATGNDGSARQLGLGTLTVAGNLANSNLRIALGNAAAIAVGGTVTGSSVSTSPPAGAAGVGAIGQLTAGQWFNSNLDAGQVGSLKVTGNPTADLIGNVTGSTFAFHQVARNPVVTGAPTFSAAGVLSGDSFTFDNGGFAAFTAVRAMQSTNLTAAGNLGTVSVGSWSNSNLIAASVGTIRVTGGLQAAPATRALIGSLTGSTLDAFAPSGTAPAIGTLSVAGALSSDILTANGGVTTLTVGRAVSQDTIQASGRIGTLTAGQWNNTNLEVASLGAVSVTGYRTPELSTGRASGDIVSCNLTVTAASSTAPHVGIGSLTVAGSLDQNSALDVPFGISSLTVAGAVSGSRVTVDNPLTPAAGQVGTLTAGGWTGGGLRAGSVGTFKTTGNAALGLTGDLSGTDITLTVPAGSSTAPVGLAALSVAGNLSNDAVNIPAGVGSVTVSRSVQGCTVAAGFGAGAGIKALTVGSWSQSSLTTQNIGTWSVIGKSSIALTGDVSGSLITILGSANKVGLGTFLAAGTVTGSTFDVANGNVASFTVGRFLSSDLLVGFRFPRPIDLLAAATPASAAWVANDSIGLFRTTAAFTASDPANTAAFQDSNVVAATLGQVIITGFNPNVPAGSETVAFGVGFRGNGGAAGTATIQGKTESAGFASGAFHYQGLGG